VMNVSDAVREVKTLVGVGMPKSLVTLTHMDRKSCRGKIASVICQISVAK
jgi:hypothetical protein